MGTILLGVHFQYSIIPAFRQILLINCVCTVRRVGEKGGSGRNRYLGLTGSVHTDGASPEYQPYSERIASIGSLYICYLQHPNQELAKKTYMLIDSTVPIDSSEEDVLGAYEIAMIMKHRDKESADEVKKARPHQAKLAQKLLNLSKLFQCLRNIKTEDQWATLIAGYEASNSTWSCE